jgi:hypothetical protein
MANFALALAFYCLRQMEFLLPIPLTIIPLTTLPDS